MIRKGLLTALVFVFALGAGPAAAQFLAADLIYLPAVTHTDGEGDSRWRSDVFITNVDDVDIDIAIVYHPYRWYRQQRRLRWTGHSGSEAREADGFGYIDPELANIPPNGTVVLRDPVGEYWATAGRRRIIPAHWSSSRMRPTPSRTTARGSSKMRSSTRASTRRPASIVPDPDNEGEFLPKSRHLWQTLPGVPWYNLADPSAVGDDGDFSFQILTGAKDDAEYQVQRRRSQRFGSVDHDHPCDSAVPGQRRAVSRRERVTDRTRSITMPPAVACPVQQHFRVAVRAREHLQMTQLSRFPSCNGRRQQRAGRRDDHLRDDDRQPDPGSDGDPAGVRAILTTSSASGRQPTPKAPATRSVPAVSVGDLLRFLRDDAVAAEN